MATSDLAGRTTADLDARFRVTQLLPILLLAFVLGALVLAGAPGQPPDLQRVGNRINDGDWSAPAAIVVISVLLALVLRPFQTQVVRLLEGYWGPGTTRATATKYLQLSQLARREKIESQLQRVGPSVQSQLEYQLRWFPDPERLLPTRLGNILRSIEDNAGQRYGLNTIATWSRLYPLLSEVLRSQVDKARDEYDTSARLSAGLGIVAGVAAVMLLPNGGWWRIAPALLLSLSYMSYRAACAAARYYGTTVYAAFDLHRFDLLQKLGMDVPGSPDTQYVHNQALSGFFGEPRAGRALFPFRHCART